MILNVHKWCNLNLSQLTSGCPAFEPLCPGEMIQSKSFLRRMTLCLSELDEKMFSNFMISPLNQF